MKHPSAAERREAFMEGFLSALDYSIDFDDLPVPCDSETRRLTGRSPMAFLNEAARRAGTSSSLH